jgi:hypothetical protein
MAEVDRILIVGGGISNPGSIASTRPPLPAYFLAAGVPPPLRTCTRSPTSIDASRIYTKSLFLKG